VGILASLFGEKNPIESLSLDELKIAEIQLKKKIETIHAEIHRSELEEERLILLGQATNSKAEKKSISGQVVQLRNRKNAQLSAQSQIQDQLHSISNLIIIKEQWKDLPEKVKRVLMDTPADKMESYLISMQITTKNAADQRDLITNMTNNMLNNEVDLEENDDGILPELMVSKKEPVLPVQDTKSKPKKELE
jgi:hypothetical protein